MNEPSSRPFNLALAGVGLLVLVALSLLIVNLVSHATHKVSVTRVTATVLSVSPLGDDKVVISAEVTSRSTTGAQVACLIGVERPAMPLAYPIRVTKQLGPGETKTLTVTRTLLKPVASQVGVSDVAFACT